LLSLLILILLFIIIDWCFRYIIDYAIIDIAILLPLFSLPPLLLTFWRWYYIIFAISIRWLLLIIFAIIDIFIFERHIDYADIDDATLFSLLMPPCLAIITLLLLHYLFRYAIIAAYIHYSFSPLFSLITPLLYYYYYCHYFHFHIDIIFADYCHIFIIDIAIDTYAYIIDYAIEIHYFRHYYFHCIIDIYCFISPLFSPYCWWYFDYWLMPYYYAFEALLPLFHTLITPLHYWYIRYYLTLAD